MIPNWSVFVIKRHAFPFTCASVEKLRSNAILVVQIPSSIPSIFACSLFLPLFISLEVIAPEHREL